MRFIKYYLLAGNLFLLAGAFGQNFSADPLTGRAVGSIPIWTVNAGNVSAGISLSYYSGGIKVNESERSAGMGWSLVAGGSVSREVRDLPDDFVGSKIDITDLRNGWLHGNTGHIINGFSPSGDLNFTDCSDETTDFSTLNGFANVDTEPDIFSFSAPGLSGQFVFDKDKVIQTIPYQDLKIEVTRQSADSLIVQIVITNSTGTKYTFLAGDKTSRTTRGLYSNPAFFARAFNLYNHQVPTAYYSSWYLSQIYSPKGGSVTFSYGDIFTSASPDFKQVVDSVTHAIDTVYADNYSVDARLLHTITGSNEVATFTWTGNLLSSVSISDLTYESLTKKFDLQYHYVKGSGKVPVKKRVKRAFLSGLMEELNCSAFPGYQFTYHGVNFSADTTSLPFNSGIRQDIFGYYDSTATSAVPDIYIKSGDTGTDGERYRIASASGYSLMDSGSGGRAVNASKVYFGMLGKVTFPSGGTTTYTYGAADYYDAETSATIAGGGARVKSIITSANDAASDVTTTYKYCTSSSPSISSGQWTYRPMFVAFKVTGTAARVPYNLAPDETIYYSRVEVSSTGRGKTVYEFQNAGMYAVTSSNDFSATLTRMARASRTPCVALGDMRSGYYSYPYAPNTNYDFERALPTYVTDFTSDGKLVQRKIYTYQRTTLTVANVPGIRLEAMNQKYQYGKYNLLANVNKMTLTESLRVYDQVYTDTATQYIEKRTTYTYNGNQMLSQTAQTNSDGNTLYNVFKYAKDYAGTGTDHQSVMINALVANNQHATLVETQSLNGSTVTGASLTLFDNTFGNSAVLPMKQLVLGDPTGFTASAVSGSRFSYDSTNYYPVAYYDAYDYLSQPTIIRDQSRALRSTIPGYNNSASALDIANARYDQVVFHDFEPGLITTAATTGSIVNTDSWSGKNSVALTSSTNVHQTTVVRGAGKFYRFSCWAKASANTTLSVSINGGSAVTLAYPDSAGAIGNWRYLELKVDMSGVSAGSNFSFNLTASGNINLDNVVFYPASASIAAHAYDPLNGKTADLDSRGVSGFKDYDALGRMRYLRNMDKDIVQIKDYHYQSANGVLPVSSFAGPASPNTCASSAYTANASCDSGVTYAWYVDDVIQSGTVSTFSYTFNDNRPYRLKLIASATFGSSATEMVVNPVLVLTTALTGSSGSFNCADTSTPRDLSVTITSCFAADNITYKWYSVVNGVTALLSTTSVDSSTSGTSYTYTSSYSYGLVPNFNNQVYCVVSCTSKNENNGSEDIVTKTTTTKTFTWSPLGSC